MHLFIKNKYMRAEHQYNLFHIYHDRYNCTVFTFQLKLFFEKKGIYNDNMGCAIFKFLSAVKDQCEHFQNITVHVKRFR